MNLKEYQSRALETAMFPPEQALNYLALGLCSEIAEILELQARLATDHVPTVEKELGDVLWYCAVLAHHTGVPLLEKTSDYSPAQYGVTFADGMAMHAGLIAGKAKKVIRDSRPIDPLFLHIHIGAIVKLVDAYARNIGSSVETICSLNIEKLASRKARGVIQGSGDNR